MGYEMITNACSCKSIGNIYIITSMTHYLLYHCIYIENTGGSYTSDWRHTTEYPWQRTTAGKVLV